MKERDWVIGIPFLVMGIVIFVFLITLGYEMISYRSPQLLYLNNENYAYVKVVVEGDSHTSSYYGAISKEEYQKWAETSDGAIFIDAPCEEGVGWLFKNEAIISITRYNDKEAKGMSLFYTIYGEGD